MFLAPWSKSRLKKKNQGPELLGKKSGAGVVKKLPAPQTCEKIKSIRKVYGIFFQKCAFFYHFSIILLVSYFLQSYLSSLRGKSFGLIIIIIFQKIDQKIVLI